VLGQFGKFASIIHQCYLHSLVQPEVKKETVYPCKIN